MLQKYWLVILAVGFLLIKEGSSQCFTGTGCTGDTLPAASQRECCIATNDGLSYRDGTSCNLCIVHGFVSAVYNVDEEDRLDTMFRLNVKGRTNFPDGLNIQGVITAMASGTAENSDFEELQPIRVANNAGIRLFTRNDETTLEYDDSVILTFTPDNPALIDGLEGEGEYVRASAIVNIIDNDQLQINFEESDYSITEGSILSVLIRLQFRNNQNAFNITLSPVTITTAEGKGLGRFIDSGTIDEATAGADFTDTTITVQVPASTTDGAQIFELPDFFNVTDDNIDEIEQSFAIVAEIGPDVPDTPPFSCFQTQAGGTECFGRRGATEIRITDNDPMIIGFTTRSQTVSEGNTPPGIDRQGLTIDVETLRTSERVHTIVFRHLESRSTAIVQSNVNQTNPLFDALFGNENNDPIEERFFLQPEQSAITSLVTAVINDFRPEKDECYTIGIFTSDRDMMTGARELFRCNDGPNATEFLCDHTICIVDNDDPFVVAFVQTTYTVIEGEGPVEVCVNLTFPEIDILEENVTVNVSNYPDSIYIPTGAKLATPDEPDFLSRYLMMDRTDYAEQTTGVNLIDDELINATNRIVCYNQPIYDDMRLEMSEYAGLTLGVRRSTVLTVVQPMYNYSAINILDDDNAVVGLERTFYQVFEDVGVVEVCANVTFPNIECPIEFPFNFSISTINISAVYPMDYDAVSTIIVFDTCETQQCIEITIVNDMVLENVEVFNVTLERTPGLDDRIKLDPVDATIEIIDPVDAVVGLEKTFYNVSEDIGVVEVCAIVRQPNGTECPIAFSFPVSISSMQGSAMSPMDYSAVSQMLIFDRCERRRCVNVSIADDMTLENIEMFRMTLERPPGLGDSITLDPVEADIVIFDNDDAVVGLERTLYNVSEDVGVVEVCAIVINPNRSIVCPIDISFTVAISSRELSAVSPMDYITVLEMLTFNRCQRRRCVDVPIVDDMTLENIESFILTLERTPDLDGRITLEPVDGVVLINDNDDAVVGLEETLHQVSEGDGVVEVCTVVIQPDTSVSCPIAFPFTVDFNSTDDSADAPGDYGDEDTTLMFAACQRRQCVNISIVDDEVLEQTEVLDVAIRRTVDLDSRILLAPIDGEIEIDDDDVAVFGLEMTFYTASEEDDPSVEVCIIVYEPDINCPITFPFNLHLFTEDITAFSVQDYIDVDQTVTISACSRRRCVDVSIVNDEIPENTERLNVTLEESPGLNDRISLNPVNAMIEITDGDAEPPAIGVIVNDTLTGDPLFTVPIHTDMSVMQSDLITSLCYEVHGEADKFFNLVSDTGVSVNAHYARASTGNSNITLNVVDAIGVKAVSSANTVVNISVRLEGCQATVDGVAITSMYRMNGITVRKYTRRVRIVVPNCVDMDLVMWVFCTSGQTEDPFTWVSYNFNFIRFVVMRGLNLAEESHGLIGQFWNVPVDVIEHTGLFHNIQLDYDYNITVHHPGNPPDNLPTQRSFVGLRSSVTWEFEQRPCLYVGNSQAGPLGEDVVPNDSVIEGTYRDYEVESMFAPEYRFSHFDEATCMN